MKEFRNLTLGQERALYGIHDALVSGCVFDGPEDGESALKECGQVQVEDCKFHLRYPLWHVTGGALRRCDMTEGCRAALWYDRDLHLEDCRLGGIKALRECREMTLERCQAVSAEFGWFCQGVTAKTLELTGEYPFLHSSRLTFEALTLHGKYSFQYVENAVIRNSHLETKDAFWHSRNVTVEDSVIQGEYLGWYSENLRLIRCRIRGTQPLCYARNLYLEDCVMEEADLSFENSDVTATVRGELLSVKNPRSGLIRAESIGEVILDEFQNRENPCRIETGAF